VLEDAEVVAFTATTDLERARAFYADSLGLPLVADTPIALVFPGLRVTLVDEVAPAAYTVAGWVVADIAAEVAALSGRGVAFNRFPGMEQDDLGIWTTPGGDKVAWFSDPDGNTLSLTELSSGTAASS